MTMIQMCMWASSVSDFFCFPVAVEQSLSHHDDKVRALSGFEGSCGRASEVLVTPNKC